MNLTGGGAFYSQTPKSCLEDIGVKKPAFTLAEILVTLGVIGIIAAMTLPMLARNYNFYIRQQQFKKAYAMLSIAVQKTQIDMGEGVRCYYMLNPYRQVTTDCQYFYSEMAKQLQAIKVCDGNALRDGCISPDLRGGEVVYAEVQGGDDPEAAKNYFIANCGSFKSNIIKNNLKVYMFNGGFSLMPYGYDNNPIMAVDINANKGPNKWGYDIFVWRFVKTKNTDSVFKLEFCTSMCHPLEKGGYYSTTFGDYLYGQNAEL